MEIKNIKKIGVVLSDSPKDSETFLISFLSILVKHYQVTVFLSGKSKNIPDGIRQKYYIKTDVTGILRMPLALIKLLLNIGRFKFLLNKKYSLKQLISDVEIWTSKNLDYIHYSFGNLIIGREYYGEIIGSKTTISFRGSDANVYPIWHKISYFTAIQIAHKIHLNSENLKQKLKVHNEEVLKKGEIIYPGVRTAFLIEDSTLEKWCSLRNQNKTLQLISVGRLHWIKGYETIFVALEKLKRQGILFNYTIIGSGPEHEKFSFLLDFFQIKEFVSFKSISNTESLKMELQKSNLFLQTSWAEGFSNSTLEAQALGLPVVVTPVSGMHKIIEHRKNGYILEDFSSDALINGINWYLGLQVSQIDELAKMATNRIRNNFNYELLSKKWVDFFN